MPRVQGKKRIREHLQALGMWQEFVAKRTAYNKSGFDMADSWLSAIRDFQHVLDSDIPSVSMATEHQPLPPENPELGPPAQMMNQPDLVDADVFEGKSCSHREAVEWVASKIAVSEPDPSEAPSSGAWSMLIWARSSLTNQSEFWRQIFTKLMPTRSEIDSQSRFSDDGSDITKDISELLRISNEDND